MRPVSARWRQMVGSVVQWRTLVDYSNDGGQSWTPAEFLGGKVTAASTSTVRWSADLTILGPVFGGGGVNPFTTRLRVRHGMAGEPLLPMGVYLCTDADWSSDWPDAIHITGKSFEVYLQEARFTSARTFYPQSADELLRALITEVLPRAQISWRGVDGTEVLPKIDEPRDRWALIDGDRDATSIARALGARVFAGPAGEWIVAPVPTLQDPIAWTVAEGVGGVLLSHGEALSRDGVSNVMVVSGEATDGTPTFRPGVAMDLDPLSLTFAQRSPDDGGFGQCPRFYTSPLIRTTAAAQKAAQSMLAPYLGLKQQITFTQLHDPSIEPGDVGLVQTRKGPRLVIMDSVDYDLTGSPMSGQTRTTATTLAGTVTEQPEDAGGE